MTYRFDESKKEMTTNDDEAPTAAKRNTRACGNHY
jgi:hypothetical protein